MRIGIMQPGYLPWLGYFEQMSRCDIFAHLDTVQYTQYDWRNRNRIKTKNGVEWLTVPVGTGHRMKIDEVLIKNEEPWSRKHLASIRANYGRTRFFNIYFGELTEILNTEWPYLVDLDIELIGWLSKKLGINIKTVRTSQLPSTNEDKQFRIVEICKKLGCNQLYVGQKSQSYIETDMFAVQGITVEFQEYKHPYYNQTWSKKQGFISYLSIIDLLFNHGPDSLAILKNEKIIAPVDCMQIRNANDL